MEAEIFVRPALTYLRGNEVVKEYMGPAICPSAGIGLAIPLRNKAWISTGVMYDVKGGRDRRVFTLRDANNEPAGTDEVTTENKFQYITVPLRWAFRFGSKIQYEVGAGVYGAFLIKATMLTEGTGYSYKPEFTDSYKRVDVGVSAALKVLVPLNKSLGLTAGVDDNLGVFDLILPDVKHQGSLKHNSLGITIGLKYAFTDRSVN
jgi:hypothetical protein